MKILLIDRNHNSMHAFKELLGSHGYRVYTAWNQGDEDGVSPEFFQGLIMVCLTGGGKTQLQVMQEIRAIPAFSLTPILFCGPDQTAESLARVLFDDCGPFLPAQLSQQGPKAIVSQLSGFLLREAA